jgi:hypothetical protein
MSDIKFFHKILIVIALLIGLSKLSKINFSAIGDFLKKDGKLQAPKCTSQPKMVVRNVERRPAPQKEYSSVPLVDRMPVQVSSIPSADIKEFKPRSYIPVNKSMGVEAPRSVMGSRSEVGSSGSSNNSIVFEDLTSSREANSVCIDDETYNKFFR